MTGHLARLAVRATRPTAGGLRPRVAALYEQPAGPGQEVGVLPVEADADAPPALGPPSGAHPAAGSAPVPAARSDEDRRPGPGAAPAAQARDARPHRSTDRGGGRPARPRTSAGEQLAAREPGSWEQEPAPSVHQALAGEAAVPAAVLARTLSAAALCADDLDRSPSADSDDVAPDRSVRAAPAAAGPPPAPLPLAPLRPAQLSPVPLPPAQVPPAQVPPTPFPPAPFPPAPLPRLQAPPPTRAARSDRPPAAPEVVVSIGRIEVVPPAPEPPRPARRPRQPARAAGAPALADYLRQRTRR